MKFHSIEGEVPILERMRSGSHLGYGLYKSLQNKLILRVEPTQGKLQPITSPTIVTTGASFQIVISGGGRYITLFVNGTEAGREGVPASSTPRTVWGPVTLRTDLRKSRSLNGLIDEVNFFSRDLSAKEIQDLFRRRSKPPCQP